MTASEPRSPSSSPLAANARHVARTAQGWPRLWIAATALCLWSAACGDDLEVRRGAPGERCLEPRDCREPLTCTRGACATHDVPATADPEPPGGRALDATCRQVCLAFADCVAGRHDAVFAECVSSCLDDVATWDDAALTRLVICASSLTCAELTSDAFTACVMP